MTKQETALRACTILEEYYPESVCALQYKEPYELLIASHPEVQGIVGHTKGKVKVFANLEELEQAVKPCGFYHMKAKSIKEMAIRLLTVYDGKIPDTMEELLTLPGVGRKTANLILGDVYKQPAIVTDTHFIRITGRLGLTTNKEPAKVERDLRPLIPPERSSDFCHRIVQFGRDICRARKPLCGNCPMADFCPSREA